MISRWLRGGIRTQITVMVLIGAVLTTAVTLLIADASIQGYAIQQAQDQEARNMNVAILVLQRSYGKSISVDSKGNLVIDSPNKDTTNSAASDFGRLALESNSSYVDQVRALLNDVQVSVYQCSGATNQPELAQNKQLCPRISTTLVRHDNAGNVTREVDATGSAVPLPTTAVQQLALSPAGTGLQSGTNDKLIQETLDGVQYLSAYHVFYDPNNHLVAVLSVSEPLTALNALINRTTIELIISGVIIMLGGIILALLVASTISGTLQRAATQLAGSSSQLAGIADAQSAGSRQQVWAINAINQALLNLQETSNDVSQRTDQLAQIGSQVAMRRAEIAPAQFESIMAYMTRSAGDISVASRHQTTTIERMSSAMEAVVEIADQVSSSSQQTTDSARRLDSVIGELEQLVTGKKNIRRAARSEPQQTNSGAMNSGQMNSGQMNSGQMGPSGQMNPGMMGPSGQMPMNGGQMPMSPNGSRPRQGGMGGPPMGGGMSGQMPMSNSRPNGQMSGGYGGMPGPGRGGMGAPEPPPQMGRPMLPSADRNGQSRPRMREQDGWDRSSAPDQGNNPYGYGGQSPWPNSDQGRNNR